MFPAVNIIYTENDVGRKKVWNERVLLSLKTETLDRVDAALRDDETRLDLIREAVERELKRRARSR